MALMAPLLIDTSAFVWTVGVGGTARDFGHSSRLIYIIYVRPTTHKGHLYAPGLLENEQDL